MEDGDEVLIYYKKMKQINGDDELHVQIRGGQGYHLWKGEDQRKKGREKKKRGER